ncbi:MAG TPA: ATP-binding protein [Sphingomonas sp.]|nr:ATP-binding protein [Sphingomonas sp.]
MTGKVEAIRPGIGRRWFTVTPLVELLVLATVIGVAVASYFIIASGHETQRLLTPPLVALLLVANLAPEIALLVLVGRRIAIRRAAKSHFGGGRLHVRLVALFSVTAAVPMLLVTIFASLLFQYGVEFWFSDRARGMLENTTTLARISYDQMLDRWRQATITAAHDISGFLNEAPMDDPQFPAFFGQQIYYRSLSEGILFSVGPGNEVRNLALENPRLDVMNPYGINPLNQIDPKVIASLNAGSPAVQKVTSDRIETIAKVPGEDNLYLYAARVINVKLMRAQTRRADAVLKDYRSLLARSRSLQIKFNTALLLVSLLIVGIAVWIALLVADRLVRPLSELVGAAQRIEEGDLAARVSPPSRDDEIGTLALAFNRMTSTLEAQTNALENRRALIEAVMSGVSAGVISIDADRTIQLVNSSAAALLNTGGGDPVGRPLAAVAPELDALLDSDTREAIVQVAGDSQPKTLAVKITGDAEGQVLTFDDITQQLLDQRRAAWSDVARRIAHEIKNPLTPIQLAAERLQRRYGKQFDGQDATFNRLTDTIVRQVGDLRRMVDEFSSFARMPKPVFREESLVDIGRQALFLHEVAHPNVRFRLEYDEPPPMLVCDRRQIGQALTNLVKNAVEAIEAKGEDAHGEVTMMLAEHDGTTTITVEDDGVGLPSERNRLVEPYVTTRARGTGLGLAIVKKIAEEHFGEITFADRPGGGTIIAMRFDAKMLAGLDGSGDTPADDAPLPALTRTRNS